MSDVRHFDEEGTAQTQDGESLGEIRVRATAIVTNHRAALDRQVEFYDDLKIEILGANIDIEIPSLEPFTALITRIQNGRVYFSHQGRFPEGRI